MAAFSSAAQLRRRPAPVNTSTRRARSDTCISSEIDICRSSKPAPNIIPFTPGAGRCSPDDAYDLIKVLWHDGQGLCLYAKRLERSRFLWPSPAERVVTITPAQ